MPLSNFHLNLILMLMITINKKEFLFHVLNIRAEGYSSLSCLNERNRGTIVGARMLIGRCPYDFQFGKKQKPNRLHFKGAHKRSNKG